MTWVQDYDPLGAPLASTLLAAVPICLLLGLIVAGVAAHRAGLVDEIALFTVRRLVARMGLENLIEAFRLSASRRRGRRMRLFIAGKGPLRSRLEALMERNELLDSVRLLGFVPDDLLKKYYRAADAFVMPTEQLEGFGIVSIEALASDLPVIATPAGANPEVAGAACPELLARSTEAADIAEKIDYFVEHRAEYEGRKYSEAVGLKYNWDNIIDEIEALLRTHTGQDPGRRTRPRQHRS